MFSSLPPVFENQMEQQIGSASFEAFKTALLLDAAPTTVQLHPVKLKSLTNEQQIAFSPDHAVPWYSKYGRVLMQRPSFAHDPLWHAGAYYAQEAASMFLGFVLQQLQLQEQWPKTPVILDACAAPGGKSWLAANFLQNRGLLVCNETIQGRLGVLTENICKAGWANTMVTNAELSKFAGLGNFFDLVILDAPCSGEGLFRKDPSAMQQWSLQQVGFCAARQKSLLSDVEPLVKPGGYLIYSTCTFNKTENEHQIAQFLATHPQWSIFKLPNIDPNWSITAGDNDLGYRFYPHCTIGEGFYLAVLYKNPDAPARQASFPENEKNARAYIATSKSSGNKKKNQKHSKTFGAPPQAQVQQWLSWIAPAFEPYIFYNLPTQTWHLLPQDCANHALAVQATVRVKKIGIELGQIAPSKGILLPAHDLALSVQTLRPDLPCLDLPLPNALQYLRRETLTQTNYPEGQFLVTYQNLPLGWANGLQNRINNGYPMAYRLRK